MTAYYNEIDGFAAAWLRELISDGLIAFGEVDERSITEIEPADLKGFTQCHFFAGIGGWSYALRLAGWPDDRPVWTASVPCQPYSVASVGSGGAQGVGDARDLWPILTPIICKHRPPTVFGEQVRGAISWGWWDRTALDLESQDYATAALVLRADAVGAAHERQRLYWVAHACGTGWPGYQPVKCVPISAQQAQSVYGDDLARARAALDGDFNNLLHCDGVSVVMERRAVQGFGNAVVPQVAAEFVRSACQ